MNVVIRATTSRAMTPGRVTPAYLELRLVHGFFKAFPALSQSKIGCVT